MSEETLRRTRRLAVAVGVVAAIAAASRLLLVRPSPSKRLFRSAASTPWRPVEARLSGFDYVPRRQHDATDDALRRVRTAAAAVLADPRREPHTTAIAMLLRGDSAEAIRALEALTAREPNHPAYWSDLAGARLEEGANTGDAQMIALALAAADRALALQPAHPEARFNRALALDALGIRFAAADAWQRYLDVDAGSPWAVEARERLRAAQAPTRAEAWKTAEVALERASARGDAAEIERIVRAFPQHTRAAAETTYLWRWGEAFTAGDAAGATRRLTLARRIGVALQKVNGESLVSDAVSAIDAAGERLPVIAGAYVAYGRARAAQAERKFAEANAHFVDARRGFAAAGHPAELPAALFHAHALIDSGDSSGAAALAAHLEQHVKPSYRSLQAFLAWLQARLANGAGRHYETFVAAEHARQTFLALGESDNAARLHTAAAAMLARLGRDREAWQARHAALAASAESGRATHIETAIDAIARDEAEGPNPEIARALLEVQVAAPTALPLTRFNGLLWQAFLDGRQTGRTPDLTIARDAAMRIPDRGQRDDAMDELRLVEALAIESTAPAAAEKLFSDVIAYRGGKALEAHLPAIHLHRGRVRRALSRGDEAMQDFLRAIELTESRRESIRSDTIRDAFLGHSDDAYIELAALLLERGEWERAFEVVERTRARILVDREQRIAVRLQDVKATIATGTLAAHYTAFDAQTLLVVIERGKATHHVIRAGRAELERKRDALTAAVATDDANEIARLSRGLYDLLVRPISDRLRGAELLVIVPDESTYAIPFAALRSDSGTFLFEEAALAFAPTAAAIPVRPVTFAFDTAQAAIFADPAFSPDVFPTLERLPAARRDASSLRSRFARSTTHTGDDATSRALAAAAQTSDVLHVAAHALSSARDASLSLIALAPSRDDAGVVSLDDVQSLTLRRRPLVVLAGCETGSLGGGKGSIRSLAHAFLAAGSSAVLSTLWNVDDRAASEITGGFYDALARGATLPAAVRETQLAAMRSRPLREWAAFQIQLGVVPAQEKSRRDTQTP